MKVTKYPQSCLVVEKDGHSIAIDPGSFFTAKYSQADLGPVEAALYTHQHQDHLDVDLAEQLRSSGVKLYGNADVAAKLGGDVTVVESGKPFETTGFRVMPHDLPHCKLPDGSSGPQNTGYIIDDNFFHPGDGVETSGVTVNDLAVPIAGPDITFKDAVQFALELKAKRVIPIHFSNHDFFPGNPHGFATATKDWFNLPFEVIVLADGESAEL